MEGPLSQVGSKRPRLPDWARKGRTHFEALNRLKSGFRELNLHTVCESARCPNIHECFHRGAATFLILGDRCTRACGFCSALRSGPAGGGKPDPAEPANVASMAAAMELKYVVITSVTRDDLDDGGSRHFAETVREVHRALPGVPVEALIPDFRGDRDAIARVLKAGLHVFNHNVETVPRLYGRVRPQADYQRSLDVLAFAASFSGPQRQEEPEGGLGRAAVKSGFMVGLGETEDEVRGLLRDLRASGVEIVTIGQYLQPTRRNLPVAEYVAPDRFEAYREYGMSLGFKTVFSGPLVRSSYMAEAISGEAGRQ